MVGKKGPPPTNAVGGHPGRSTIGTPSAGLSLGGLHACRARLRFARQQEVSTAGRWSKRCRAGRQPQQTGNREAGRVVAVRRVSEGKDATPDGPERPVYLVTIGVP